MAVPHLPVSHIIAVFSASIYLVAVAEGWQNVKYLLKPTTTLLIAHPVRPNSDKVYYGLLLSTLGDILLMLPASNETFMFGLLSFLAAHVFYAMAFKRQDKGKGVSRVRWTSVPFGAFASAMLWMLIPGVKREGGVVTVGVVVYVVAISVMAYRSTLTGKGLLVLGSVLFCISDSVLAWDRFLGHLAWGEMAVMSTYYAAQLCIALAHSS